MRSIQSSLKQKRRFPLNSQVGACATEKKGGKSRAASKRASPVVVKGISPDRYIQCIYHLPSYCEQKRGDNDPLTILTSDTISMLAMSIFIPTPTGGPAGGQGKKCQKLQNLNIKCSLATSEEIQGNEGRLCSCRSCQPDNSWQYSFQTGLKFGIKSVGKWNHLAVHVIGVNTLTGTWV